MRRVAVQTTVFCLHRSVLEDEWPHAVSVALGADRELSGCGPHLVAHLRPVWVVAVTALDESGIYAVPVRPGELRLLCRMTSIAKVGLLLHQQEVHVRRLVRTVTRRTTHAVSQMCGFGKVLRLQAGLVALGADRRRLRRTQRLKANDFRGIAAAVHVRLRRAVACLTTVLIALQQRSVRSIGELLVPYFLVATLTNVRGGVLSTGGTGQRG